MTLEQQTKLKSKEEVSWNRICEQSGHIRFQKNRPTSFLGQLRESLQTKQHRTILDLKRSTLNEQ